MYTIKNFTKFKGHEGEPLAQGTIHGPNGKVADWSDDSHGGPFRLDFVNSAAQAEFILFAKKYLADKKDYNGELYKVGTMTAYDLCERAAQALSFTFEEDKMLLKEAKKGLAYYRADATEPSGKALYVAKAPYTAENVAALRAKHLDLLEILNERFGLPLVDAEQHKKAEEDKYYRKLCKTATIFSIKEPGGNIKMMRRSALYSPLEAEALRKANPNLVEIVNERYL